MKTAVHKLAGGDIVLWGEPGGPIMIKTVESHGDPVELNEDEAAELVAVLNLLIAEIS